MPVIILLGQDTHYSSPHDTLVLASKENRTMSKGREKKILDLCFVEPSSSLRHNSNKIYHEHRLNFLFFFPYPV